MKKLVLVLLALSFLLLGCTGDEKAGQTVAGWCKANETVTVKNVGLNVVGTENQPWGEACRLTATQGGVTVDFYLDEQAFGNFAKGTFKEDVREFLDSGDSGNGCIVETTDSQETGRMCFGSKTKATPNPDAKREEEQEASFPA